MYAFVEGKFCGFVKEAVVIEAGGIGYRVFTSMTSQANMPSVGERVKVHTHLHVREDAMLLYGFTTVEELNLFEHLITVSGIGPKVALGVLSSMAPSHFSLLVVNGDAKGLTKAPGIGLKTAQRVILDLKDKFMNITVDTPIEAHAKSLIDPEKEEALNALLVLGYSRDEAQKAIEAIFVSGLKVEEVIKRALRALAR